MSKRALVAAGLERKGRFRADCQEFWDFSGGELLAFVALPAKVRLVPLELVPRMG